MNLVHPRPQQRHLRHFLRHLFCHHYYYRLLALLPFRHFARRPRLELALIAQQELVEHQHWLQVKGLLMAVDRQMVMD